MPNIGDWVPGNADELMAAIAGTAAGRAFGAELGRLVILQLEKGPGAVATALADATHTDLYGMLLVAVTTLSNPAVIRALASGAGP